MHSRLAIELRSEGELQYVQGHYGCYSAAAINLQRWLSAGSEDKSAPFGDCLRICDGITSCRMEVLEGMGHGQCVEAPRVGGMQKRVA